MSRPNEAAPDYRAADSDDGDLKLLDGAKIYAGSEQIAPSTGGGTTKHSETFGDGVEVQYDITHGLGTRDVIVQVRRVASPYDEIVVHNEALDTNTVRLIFDDAPATDAFRVIVL